MQQYLDVLKKYAVFEGRAARAEYWNFVLWNIIVGVVLSFFVKHFVDTLYMLAVLVPGLAVAVRRLHDTSRSGWWLLICFIPLIGAIILIVFLATDSTPGANEYGANPKGLAPAPVPAPAPTPTAQR